MAPSHQINICPYVSAIFTGTLSLSSLTCSCVKTFHDSRYDRVEALFFFGSEYRSVLFQVVFQARCGRINGQKALGRALCLQSSSTISIAPDLMASQTRFVPAASGDVRIGYFWPDWRPLTLSILP